MNGKIKVGSLFSGIGGIELGLEWTGGFETVWQVEIDSYCNRVLSMRWPNVKRYGDIRSLDGIQLEPVDLICGGFPCQDISVAGRREGIKGERSGLWYEMLRVICQVKPRWVLVENVRNLLSIDAGGAMLEVLRGFAEAGYDAEWSIVSAADLGAPHLRQRIFIIAHADSSGCGERRGAEPVQEKYDSVERPGEDVPDSLRHSLREQRLDGIRREGSPESGNDGKKKSLADTRSDGMALVRKSGNGKSSGIFREGISPDDRREFWAAEPGVGRVADGVPHRVDRLRCLGNAVVPQVAEYVGTLIMQAEREMMQTRGNNGNSEQKMTANEKTADSEASH